MKTSKFDAIYNQPTIKQDKAGNIDIDSSELESWFREMDSFKKDWDATMSGCENDPDEILNRMLKMF